MPKARYYKDFEEYINLSHEVGYVEEVFLSIVYCSGLPSVSQNELVVFETGDLGQILSLNSRYAEVLVFSNSQIKAGTRVTRTKRTLEVPVTEEFLGKSIDPLGNIIAGSALTKKATIFKPVDISPKGFTGRIQVTRPFETGVSIVDLVVPLGHGQRELIIGDRKSGKTSFLLDVLLTQSFRGSVCIYALIGKRKLDFQRISNFVEKHGIGSTTLIVSSSSSQSAGLVYLTPYTAMTIAEYFCDLGRDVVLILDDLTTHAKFYREVSLLARRFPGRSSYPGDIFYIHSKLLERGGAYTKGTITVLPLAETVLSDLSSYIPTNLMAITDGHVFFDNDLFNEGRRPPVNPYLSVTRVGEQTQTPLLRDISRELSRFFVRYQKLSQLIHFGTEFEQRVKDDISMGQSIFESFNQNTETVVPLPVSVLVVGLFWSNLWKGLLKDEIHLRVESHVSKYLTDTTFKQKLDHLITNSHTLGEIVNTLKTDSYFS